MTLKDPTGIPMGQSIGSFNLCCVGLSWHVMLTCRHAKKAHHACAVMVFALWAVDIRTCRAVFANVPRCHVCSTGSRL